MAHRLVLRTAQEAAGELYERLMGNNRVRTQWRKENPDCTERELVRRFVVKFAPSCIPVARATLARMLESPIDERLKEEIMDALIKDASLRRREVGVTDRQLVRGLK